MLGNLEGHALIATLVMGTLGLCYFFDRTYNHSDPEISDYRDSTYELPVAQDIPVSSEAVSTVSEKQYCLEPSEQCCISEPATDDSSNQQAEPTPGHKGHSYDYKNEFWPSPRPVNFVKAIASAESVKPEGRLTHGKAIEFLSKRAQMSPDAFLKTDPITYTKLFMPARYTAGMLIGKSIQDLEATIRRHQFIADLRKHG